ncbi:Ribosomal protein S18 acetylase RimI [Enhydrobacter aerosaccus]|uniref:Ribosomal protein S18 acetylase RimI n=1 Tax=Enhydrobacter aerosaccus TaxID=225324 RepID=A0A1T4NNS3_9HYPH|nr:GNAT family N-acetyltransferase [Enhydrobacter aerosaccus]SJZ80755.1 Ribosomal protein S18 acetylase RimI [Enhydrobacter aerosaccus]
MLSITLRPAADADMDFVHSLSPRLSGVPRPPWHDLAAMEGFQDRYMTATFDAPDKEARTLIAWSAEGHRLGYIHMRPGKDGVTGEPCGYVSLLALAKEAEGMGVAHALMQAAEEWARSLGYRLLSLDVFAHNQHAVDFYTRRGFEAETIRLVKPL